MKVMGFARLVKIVPIRSGRDLSGGMSADLVGKLFIFFKYENRLLSFDEANIHGYPSVASPQDRRPRLEYTFNKTWENPTKQGFVFDSEPQQLEELSIKNLLEIASAGQEFRRIFDRSLQEASEQEHPR